MRRLLVFMTATLLLALSACDGESDKRADPSTPGSDTVSSRPPGPSPEPLPPPRKPGYQPEVLGEDDGLDPPPVPTRECEAVEVSDLGESTVELRPPVPVVSARRVGNQILVRYRFLAAPADCAPTRIRADVGSLPKGVSSHARPYRPPVHVRVRGRRGLIRFPVPPTRPPYAAAVVASADQGLEGKLVVVRVR